MGAYLDRLNSQFDEITAGIEEILDRAADENRDVTKDEAELIEREQKKAEDLKATIDHYAGIEKTRADVEVVRSKIPAPSTKRTKVAGEEPEKKVEDLFPSVGHYICTVGRALQGDKAAGELIARAETQHQTTADNPGLIPRPILGPLINLVDSNRPFIGSIQTKPLPTGQFDRPKIKQHVGVGRQEAEKSRTESRKMIIDKLPVAADTFAGHLNISRQDIKWTSPGIMQIVAEDFAVQYAHETNEAGAEDFIASLAGTDQLDPAAELTLPDWNISTVRRVLFQAAATPMQQRQPAGVPDTFWMSWDVWVYLGSQVNDKGDPVYPGLNPGNPGEGEIVGYRAVSDAAFPLGTGVLGRGQLVEWYEDLDGLMQVAEPDVLGQMVGYAGYGALLNTAPSVFTKLTLPEIPDLAELLANAGSSDAKTSAKK